MSEAKQEIEDSHGELSSLVKDYLPNAMTISIVTMSKRLGGQMVMHSPEYDKRIVAERLRLCADILDGIAAEDAA